MYRHQYVALAMILSPHAPPISWADTWVWREWPTRDASFLMTSTENAHASTDAKVELDEAARLFALKKYESASDVLAEALETL